MEVPSIQGYEVQEIIGRGPLGTVYSARRDGAEERVAIKVFDPDVSSRKAAAMALNEAVFAGAIAHPNIARMLDIGELPDGRPYLVLELLAGGSLASRLQDGQRLPLNDALDLARQVASALGAAHDEGIVHGALKPENIFLVPDPSAPSGERVKVLDFGTRGVRAREPADRRSPYAAPEHDGEIDHRADIYGLGALLYHALCGQPPDLASPDEEPGSRPVPPHALNPDVPPAVEAIILRALAFRREDRPDSVAAFCAALSAAEPRRVSRRSLVTSVTLVAAATASAIITVRVWSRGGRRAPVPPAAPAPVPPAPEPPVDDGTVALDPEPTPPPPDPPAAAPPAPPKVRAAKRKGGRTAPGRHRGRTRSPG
jgi:serine/threonine protein kinase